MMFFWNIIINKSTILTEIYLIGFI